ncbi:Retrovirus-related Pol polyprotein from transposon 17.6, partial [Mucuna pruriens]
MGERELVITTPVPEEYIEGDEEALEASFQSLEVEGTKGGKLEGATLPPPTNTALQIMIKEGYQPGKGLGPQLTGDDSKEAVRGQSFVRGSVSAIEEGTEGRAAWVYAMQEELTNWTAKGLPNFDLLEIKNNPIIPTDNQSLGNEELDQPSTPSESVSFETEALVDIEEKPKIEAPTKDLENVSLQEGVNGREVRIGKQLPPDSRAKLIELLKEYADVFAWSYQDMPGLNREIVEHKLPLLLGSTPVRQQLRRMRPEMALKIKEEWNAGFLAVANYPQWVANIVPVPKKDGKVRMCVDYRDLNRASPKDNFPLPHINVLVDNTAQHAFFPFMDGFLGYNQIMMLLEDQEKMTFITLWGTFYYKVMPFGLKNAGATYQRAMVALFHDMMHKEIEVYVDDMIAKSKTLEQHIEDLQKLFLRLRKYKLRLNPAKCTFRVDPDKVKAIREMPAPKSKSKVKGFLGRINFISRFISYPIFKLLRKKQKKEWDSECQEAFDKIKRYLENPPVLVPAAPRRPLILYLTVLEESMDTIGKKEQPIYCLNKKFTECEARSALERTCCALVWAAKRLRPYMMAHTTWLVAKNDPVKYIFEKPALTGRIARWQMALSEYDILYVSQTTIKGSALAEQLAYHPVTDSQPLSYEFLDETLTATIEDKERPDNEWTMWFDGASNVVGNGIGVVLVSPNNQCFPFAAKLGFDCTNDMADELSRLTRVNRGVSAEMKSSRPDRLHLDRNRVVLATHAMQLSSPVERPNCIDH